MTTLSSGPRRTVASATLLALSLATSAAWAAPIFKLADDATIVVRGVVDGVQSYKKDAFLVFTITPREVLKGEATVGTPITLVEERVFGTERPYYQKGVDALVFAVPLPSYSYYRESLPDGSYWRWPDPKETTTDIAPLADPAVIEAVRSYLAAGTDTRMIARRLGPLLASPVPRVRADALVTAVTRPDVAAGLDAEALASLASFVVDDHVPAADRGAILIGLARAGVPAVAESASAAVATGGPIRAAGVDALVSLGKPPPEKELLAWSRGDDPALRIAAVRGLALSSSRPALDRVGTIVETDPSSEVRIAAIEALGKSRDPRAVPVLARAMHSEDKRQIVDAGTALARIASPEAIQALAGVLRDGNITAQTAAAFALAQTQKPEAATILREQRELHPEEKVRNAIGLALGEPGHDH